MTSTPPVRLLLRPSPRLAAAILSVHAAGGASLWMVMPDMAGMALAALLVALGFASARSRALLRGARALRAIELLGARDLLLERADGSRRAAGAAGRRHVSRLGVALTLRGTFAGAVFIAADMLDPPGLRTLRVWALWERVPGVSGASRTGGGISSGGELISRAGVCVEEPARTEPGQSAQARPPDGARN